MFTKDYPLGVYEVREIETLAGYIMEKEGMLISVLGDI